MAGAVLSVPAIANGRNCSAADFYLPDQSIIEKARRFLIQSEHEHYFENETLPDGSVVHCCDIKRDSGYDDQGPGRSISIFLGVRLDTIKIKRRPGRASPSTSLVMDSCGRVVSVIGD